MPTLLDRVRAARVRVAPNKAKAPLAERVQTATVNKVIKEVLARPTDAQLSRWGVQPCAEFDRVDQLKRRDLDPETLVEHYTRELRTPDGEWQLRPIQAWALQEIEKHGGILGAIAVGGGKALISLLAPVILDAKRPVLLVPASLRDQTNEHVIPEMKKHWKLHPNLRVISYETLSSAKQAEILEWIKPDLLICDEAHYLKNSKAARTKRVSRFMQKHPETVFVALSGTITKRSLRDYWHLAAMARREDSPLPLKWPVVCDWADAVDADTDEWSRNEAGALWRWCTDEELLQGLKGVRRAFRRRFTDTPGVITTSASSVDTGLNIFAREIDIPDEIKNELKRLRTTWETPDGDMLTEAVDVWRHSVELCCGFYYKWDPPAPQDWLEARRRWKKYVRETLKHNRRNLDTELQVTNECRFAPDKAPREYHDWIAIKDTFEPNTVPVYLSRYLVEDAERWAQRTGGIVWVSHRAVGALFETIPFFGSAGDGLLDHRGPCAASLAVHGTGKDLQHYDHMLVMAAPSSGQRWEQMLGRLHRPGQRADSVEVEVYQHHKVLQSAWADALRDAEYIEDITGQRQKLLLSTRAGFTVDID